MPASARRTPNPRPTTPQAPAPPPPGWRDPWAWASALAVLPLAAKMLGSPLGEPVAEDFDFLHRALLTGMGTLLDGGGSQAFWRPIPHQLYYAVLGSLLVAHPAVVAALHLALLALGSLLLYRALRPAWSGPMAAAAASFPLLAESTRTIAGWPTQFVDLGLFLFTALALHEAARRRLPTALAALLGALLCKELAVVTALLVPLWPAGPRGRAERTRWGIACAVLTAAWAAAYLAVRGAAHLELPHGIEHDPAVLATPIAARLAWALAGSVKATLSLALTPEPQDLFALGAIGALALVAAVAFLARADARARLARAWPWTAWGIAWFVLASGTLATIFPLWQPNRSQFGSVGLGVAAVSLLAAAGPRLVAALVAARLALLGVAPAPSAGVETLPPETGAFMDYARLTRLQRVMRETRLTLRGRFPSLPRGATVVQQNLPHAVEYALGGDRALQVWYRDPTLHWLRFDAFRADSLRPVAAMVMFQPGMAPEVVLVEPAAERAQLSMVGLMRERRWQDALAAADRAEGLQPDRHAWVFRARLEAQRAYCLGMLGRFDECERVARRGVALNREEVGARLMLATALGELGRLDESDAHLDTLLTLVPGDADALALRTSNAARRRAPAASP